MKEKKIKNLGVKILWCYFLTVFNMLLISLGSLLSDQIVKYYDLKILAISVYWVITIICLYFCYNLIFLMLKYVDNVEELK